MGFELQIAETELPGASNTRESFQGAIPAEMTNTGRNTSANDVLVAPTQPEIVTCVCCQMQSVPIALESALMSTDGKETVSPNF